MKKYFKLDCNFKQIIKIFLFVFTICSVALILVSLIPKQKINNNIEKSISKMYDEGVYPKYMKKNSEYFQIDNWTEGGLLDFIYSCDSSKPLECTFAQKYYASSGSGIDNANELIKATSPNYSHNANNGKFIIRSSYWLGIRVIYTPLLYFMDYYSIRYLVMTVALFLAFFTIIKLSEKTSWKYGLGLALSLASVNYFIGIFVSTHAMLFILTFLGMDYVLLKKKKINYFNLMFVIGMLATYFDWFSFPLITWGLVTITILLKEYCQNKKIKFNQLFNIIFKTGVAWCLGYASMLIFRLIFSFLVAGKDALEYFNARVTGNTGIESASIFNTMINALRFCVKGLIPILLIPGGVPLKIYIIVLLVLLLMCGYLLKNGKPLCLLLFIISLSSFVWIAVFSGFNIIHGWFSYRTLVILMFAVITIIIMFIEEIIIKLKNNKNINKFIKKLKIANITRFLIVGSIATLIDYLIYMLISNKLGVIIAKCLSMICACIFSFFVNKKWTFDNKANINIKMILLFIFSQVINIGVNTGINYLMYCLIKSKTIPFIIATVVAMIVNYLLQNYVVFKERKNK